MIKSMTGFGKSQAALGSRNISIDIRTLNSKQLDLNLRLPAAFRELEGELRSKITHQLERGKIDVHVSMRNQGVEAGPSFNVDLIKAFIQNLGKELSSLGVTPDAIFTEVMRMPDVLGEEEFILVDDDKKHVLQCLQDALKDVDGFRADEGRGLGIELVSRVDEIERLLNGISAFENERMETIKTRIRSKVEELIQQYQNTENRFEEEMIYFLEKLDISEEKQRLLAHCTYFKVTLNEDQSNGRKLGFISQEMGREINTIGSKANHAGMQKQVVLMKDELEKIKEQLNNVL